MKTKGYARTDIEPRLTRREELRRSLEERRSELVANLHERMRMVRAEHGIRAMESGLDDGEVSDVDMQEDIELALIQMRAETLSRIDESIARLEAGVYGQCSLVAKRSRLPVCALFRSLCVAVNARSTRKPSADEQG